MVGRGEAAGVRERTPAGRDAARHATDREVRVVEAVLVAGSEKAAAHRLGLSHSTVKHHLAKARLKMGAANTAQLVWMLAPRQPEPEDIGLVSAGMRVPTPLQEPGDQTPRDRPRVR